MAGKKFSIMSPYMKHEDCDLIANDTEQKIVQDRYTDLKYITDKCVESFRSGVLSAVEGGKKIKVVNPPSDADMCETIEMIKKDEMEDEDARRVVRYMMWLSNDLGCEEGYRSRYDNLVRHWLRGYDDVGALTLSGINPTVWTGLLHVYDLQQTRRGEKWYTQYDNPMIVLREFSLGFSEDMHLYLMKQRLATAVSKGLLNATAQYLKIQERLEERRNERNSLVRIRSVRNDGSVQSEKRSVPAVIEEGGKGKITIENINISNEFADYSKEISDKYTPKDVDAVGTVLQQQAEEDDG